MIDSPKTLVIAEVGVNHNGELETARQLIDVAVESGADIVKFQTFTAADIVGPAVPMANYQVASTGLVDCDQRSFLQKLELSESDHAEIAAYCKKKDIEFLSTGFDIKSMRFLERFEMQRIKIPSGEITNLPYLRYCGALGKPLILSTGMSTQEEVEAAIKALISAGAGLDTLTVLHCTSAYPAPIDQVNLRAMLALRQRFGVSVGYSDHTLGIEVPMAAVALGAEVIEKHLTLDRSSSGPDHQASLEPFEFASMVRGIRKVELCLGDGVKRASSSEESNRALARKVLVAATVIKKGEVFTEKNITAKRSNGGVTPMQWDNLIGRRATRDYLVDEPLTL